MNQKKKLKLNLDKLSIDCFKKMELFGFDFHLNYNWNIIYMLIKNSKNLNIIEYNLDSEKIMSKINKTICELNAGSIKNHFCINSKKASFCFLTGLYKF